MCDAAADQAILADPKLPLWLRKPQASTAIDPGRYEILLIERPSGPAIIACEGP